MVEADRVTFVVCVEPGSHRLEYKAATLFHTMRRNLGPLAKAAIWAYAPRPGREVNAWCRDLLDHFNVRLITEPLNDDHADYPLANKPLALAHAEEHAQTEFVTFLDTDILVWRDAPGFLLADGVDLAMVVDGTKASGSAGPEDRFESYWMQLYDLVGATARPFVTTLLSNEKIRGMWNSGVVVTRRDGGIAARWRDTMLAMLANNFAPREAMYLRENHLLSAIAAARFDRFRELSFAYNYAVQNWDRMSEKGIPPEQAVLWHYQAFFDKAFRRFADRMDAAGSLQARLLLTERFAADLRSNYRRRIGIDETWLRSIRRRAKIGPRIRTLFGRSKASDLHLD